MLPGRWDTITSFVWLGKWYAWSHVPIIILCIHFRITAESHTRPAHQHQEGDPKQDAGTGPLYDSEILAP